VTRSSRLAVGAGIVVAGLAAILLSQGILSRHVRGDPGPQAVPVAAAAAVVIGGVSVIVGDLRKAVAEVSEPAGRSLVAALATAAYVWLLGVLGFVPSTALFLAGTSVYLDRSRRHARLVHVMVAAAAALSLWLVFGRLLGVVLPPGPLGF
jgi:putative tricarboxylic transport membrane protein